MDSQSAESKAGFGALMDLSFRRFITVSVVPIVYLLGMALIGIVWLIGVIGAFSQGFGTGILGLIVMTLAAFLYLLFFRMSLEVLMVVFRIADHAAGIARAVGAPSSTEAPGFPMQTTPPPQEQ